MLVSLVHQRRYANVYEIAWAMCMWDMSLVVPLFASVLLGHFNACVSSKILDCNMMLEPCDVMYNEVNEEFVRVVVLRGWVSYMVIYEADTTIGS